MQRLIVSPEQCLGAPTVYLNPEQQHYLYRVLRMRPGDRLVVLDGVGHSWFGEVATGSKITLLQPHGAAAELPLSVSLAAALPKNGFDEVVRCCTELGVNTIYPVISQRTIPKPSDNRLKRWRKIAIEATEQSERLRVPTIAEPQSFLSLLPELPNQGTFLCGARADSDHLFSRLKQTSPTVITLMIGPEGGWTKAEIDEAIAHDISQVSLGPSILRTVTASITALAFANAYCCSEK